MKTKYNKNLKPQQNQRKKLTILGNGPSLKEDFPQILKSNNYAASETLCLNSFAMSDYYEIIKPVHYLIVDPIFFDNNRNVERIEKLKSNLQTSILQKTKWSMNLYIPRYYYKSDFIKFFITNKNLRITPINNVPLSGGFMRIKHFLFHHYFGNVIWQNVLLTAIFLGVQKQYKSIHIYGADHNWVKNINVLDSNQITLNDQHIDKKIDNKIILTDENGNPKQLHTFLNQIAIMFKEYHILENYAKSKNIKITNYTAGSFIDAFEKNVKATRFSIINKNNQ